MNNSGFTDKRRGGSALLIIVLILGLALLFFIFIVKQMDLRLINKESAAIEKGMVYREKDEPEEPAPTLNPRMVSLVYVTKENKLVSSFLQVINAKERTVFLVEIPLNTRLELSTELYKDLLTYAPTLPQFVKLSRAAGYFSENYRYEACTRMLSENIGIKISEWCAMGEQDFLNFTNKDESGQETDFYTLYQQYADKNRSSLSAKERWAYYEIFSKAAIVNKGTIPGKWDKSDYSITVAQAKELIEELKY